MDWVDIVSRLVTAIPRPLGRALILPTLVVPSLREAHRVLQIAGRLEQLESDGSFEAAEELREEALRRTQPDFAIPLWRSKGFDRLRRDRPDEALAAFEKGISYLGKQPTMYGVSQPHALYYGAALAALDLGERDKAKGYYRSCVNLIARSSRRGKGAYDRAWEEQLEDLRRRLGEATRGVSGV